MPLAWVRNLPGPRVTLRLAGTPYRDSSLRKRRAEAHRRESKVAMADFDKMKGKGNEMAGKAREQYGDMADDPEQEHEGENQEMKGKAQGAWGDIKDKAEDVKDKIG